MRAVIRTFVSAAALAAVSAQAAPLAPNPTAIAMAARWPLKAAGGVGIA
jgi:hypothetical protein